MQKQQYIDLVWTSELLRSNNLTKQMVEIWLNVAYNQIVYDASRSKQTIDLCRKRFDSIAVTHDSTNNVYYSTFPKDIVPNINTKLIVNTIQGNGLRFVPTTEETILLTENLLVNDIDTSILTLVKRERIEYYNMESSSDDSVHVPKVSTVRMDLAIQFKEFDVTDEVYLPNGRDYEVIQLAIDSLNKEPIMEIRNA